MPKDPDDPEIILPPDFLTMHTRQPQSKRGWLLGGIVFLLFVLFHNGVPLYTDWLWFGEVGYRTVFTTTILAKTGQFAVCALLFFAIFWGNVRIARRMAPERAERTLLERFGPEWSRMIQRGIGAGLLVISIFLSLWAGRLGSDQWSSALEFLHATPFGKIDPVFHNDIGFYVFRLPYLSFWYSFLLGTLLLTTLAVGIIHFFDGAVETLSGLPHAPRGIKSQLLFLVTALALIQAAGTRLSAFELLYQENGVFTGAGYTDLRYRLLANNAQVLFLVLTAVACLFSLRPNRNFRWVGVGAVGWAASWLLLGGLLPGVIEKAYVEPNQSSVEREYIQRNIAFTRQGFNLMNVRRVGFPADQSLNLADVRANSDTLDNVRLWDYNFLARIYAQKQTVKTFYKFQQLDVDDTVTHNIDIDRYQIGGKLRQVMLAAREMDSNALPGTAQTWQNQRLAYTHGYGLVMSPVNKAVNGDPTYFLQGFPLQAAPEASAIHVSQPDIYYGLLNHEYVFVDTTQKEFDYPATADTGSVGAGDHYTKYAGSGGIRIGDSPLAKVAFSLRLGDQNVLLSNGFTDKTRVLFRRDIRERVNTVAPFVQQDGDPYLVVNPDDGRLVWIIDCYTLTDRYPYSTPQRLEVNPVSYVSPNYIRNSVKATVDAYDGTVNLYVTDPQDPIVQTYSHIFPGLLKPLSAMAKGLHDHLRYPEDLFRLQRTVYATYHVEDPLVFYRKDDAWAIPVEPNPDSAVRPTAGPTVDPNGNPAASLSLPASPMEPYYITMRLPEETDKGEKGVGNREQVATRNTEEFLLMSPLAPISRENQNILGWMCARCDGEHYGQLVLYQFPQSASVTGPSQVVAQINNDKVISPQLALLRTGGSNATIGNMLVIPIDRSLLYVAPLYIEPTGSTTRLPQLQEVIVAFGARVVMRDTLEAALTELFGGSSAAPTAPEATPGAPPSNQPPTGPSNVPPSIRDLIQKAGTSYQAAQQKLKAGDWAGYGEATRRLEQTLKQLQQQSGGR